MLPTATTPLRPGQDAAPIPAHKDPISRAADAARAARDAALCATLAPEFAIREEWTAYCVEFDRAQDAADKVEVARRVEAAMRKRAERIGPLEKYREAYEADRLTMQRENARRAAASVPAAPPPPPAGNLLAAFAGRGIALAANPAGNLTATPARLLTAYDKQVLTARKTDLIAELRAQTFEV